MSWPDAVNGGFELCAGIAVWNHVRVLLRQRQVRGVSILSTVFFSSWGYWNLFYYPQLAQWLSFLGGLSIVTANTIWVVLMWRYRHA